MMNVNGEKSTVARIAALPLILSLMAFLASCSTVPEEKSGAWRPMDEATKSFKTNGRISVKRGKEGYYANFDWASLKNSQTFNVNTPLGNTIAQVCKDGEGVIAKGSEKRIYAAHSGEDMIRAMTGLDIPLDNLDMWSLGGYNRRISHELTSDGSLIQNGWTISRDVVGDGTGNPRKLNIGKREIQIKIVFDDFKIVDESKEDGDAIGISCDLRKKVKAGEPVVNILSAGYDGWQGETQLDGANEGDAKGNGGQKGEKTDSMKMKIKKEDGKTSKSGSKDGSEAKEVNEDASIKSSDINEHQGEIPRRFITNLTGPWPTEISRSFRYNIEKRENYLKGKKGRLRPRDPESTNPVLKARNRKKTDDIIAKSVLVDESVGNWEANEIKKGKAKRKHPRKVVVPVKETPKKSPYYNPNLPKIEA